MMIAVIADTHMPRGARRLPDACVERLRAADAILHAGDLVALAVLELLESLGPPVHAVHGNVDDPDLRMLLPAVRTVEAGGARIAMIHDAGPATGRLARMPWSSVPIRALCSAGPGAWFLNRAIYLLARRPSR